jgi:imidazolonepropionase-like amidohydrolase
MAKEEAGLRSFAVLRRADQVDGAGVIHGPEPEADPMRPSPEPPPWTLLIAAALLFLGPGPQPGVAQNLILTGASVVDVDTGEIHRDRTVVVRDGRIESIGEPGAEAPGQLPGNVERIDLRGRYLAPGLMDAHVHFTTEEAARRALHYGVTTARSMGASRYDDVALGALIRAGHAEGPELLSAGYHVRPGVPFGFFLDHPELGHLRGDPFSSPEVLRTLVEANLDRGVDWIKMPSTERAGLTETDPRRQVHDETQMRVGVEAAQARRVPVAAHAHGDDGARAAVLAGVRSIEHGTYMSEETLQLMVEMGTYLVPTIAIVHDLTLPGGDYDNAALRIRGRHMLPRLRQMTRRAHELGIPIVASTDTGYGTGSVVRVSHELMEFVEHVGMSPLEALRSATVVAAELFGIADRTGRIAPGLEADLIVVERNPLEDVSTVQDILMVVSDGRVAVRRGDW